MSFLPDTARNDDCRQLLFLYYQVARPVLLDMAFLQLLTYAALIVKVLGDATNLAIINLTPYDLVQSKDPHSYQMVNWNDAFPPTVHKGKCPTYSFSALSQG